jgi:hypothetical protein
MISFEYSRFKDSCIFQLGTIMIINGLNMLITLVGSRMLNLVRPKPNIFYVFLPHTNKSPFVVKAAEDSSEHYNLETVKEVKFFNF